MAKKMRSEMDTWVGQFLDGHHIPARAVLGWSAAGSGDEITTMTITFSVTDTEPRTGGLITFDKKMTEQDVQAVKDEWERRRGEPAEPVDMEVAGQQLLQGIRDIYAENDPPTEQIPAYDPSAPRPYVRRRLIQERFQA